MTLEPLAGPTCGGLEALGASADGASVVALSSARTTSLKFRFLLAEKSTKVGLECVCTGVNIWCSYKSTCSSRCHAAACHKIISSTWLLLTTLLMQCWWTKTQMKLRENLTFVRLLMVGYVISGLESFLGNASHSGSATWSVYLFVHDNVSVSLFVFFFDFI